VSPAAAAAKAAFDAHRDRDNAVDVWESVARAVLHHGKAPGQRAYEAHASAHKGKAAQPSWDDLTLGQRQRWAATAAAMKGSHE
jgi:hypothetical protein